MTIAAIILPEWINALGWMLIHSLWQGSALALLTAVTLSLTRYKPASFHYRVLLLTFIAFIITCAGTFACYQFRHTYYQLPAIPLLPIQVTNNIAAPPVQHYLPVLTGYIPLLVFCWFPFCCYRLAKNLAASLYARGLCNRHVFSAPDEWSERLTRLINQIQLHKKVSLLESALICTPVTLGFWKPVILMPLGMLCALPPEQIEAVLRHELAHIRRNDYLVNLFQLVTEAVFFFNPGLLWLSNQLREKREFCCDDIALLHTDNNKDYLLALVHFKAMELESTAVAIGFSAPASQLHKRVARIVNGNPMFTPVSLASISYAVTGILLLFTTMHISAGKQNAAAGRRQQIVSSPVVNRQPIVTSPHIRQQIPDTRAPAPKQPVTSILKHQTEQAPIPMDSATLSMLTGEFNTVYQNVHYVIGVAKSRITHLAVDGETITQHNWHRYNNAFAGIVHEFTIHIENTERTHSSLNNYPTQINITTPVNP